MFVLLLSSAISANRDEAKVNVANLFFAICSINFFSMNEIIIIIVLILLNGVFSMSEIAIISARKTHLASDIKRGSKSAKTAMDLANEPDRFLSTVQIGITLIGILTGLYSGDKLADGFKDILVGWGVSASYAHPVAQSVIVVAVTYLTLVLGELLPKRIGLSISEAVAKLVARPMQILSVIAAPFVWILSRSTSLLFKLLNLHSAEAKVTEEEIKSIIQEGADDGEVQAVEQNIMERVFLLDDLKVSSIMTHRNDLLWFDINMNREQVRAILAEHLFDSYPVADGSLDEIVGVVALKDLVLKLDSPDFNLRNVISQPSYFHENMNVYKALEQMKASGIGRALICDEFGSCQGIVTLRDILEVLIGTMNEPQQEPDIVKRTDAEGWLVDGQCAFYDFLTFFDKEELCSDYNYNTLSGLILEELEHIPVTGETLCWNEFKFEIVDMDGARIDKVCVTKCDKKE